MNHQRIPSAGSRASVVFPELPSGEVSTQTTQGSITANKVSAITRPEKGACDHETIKTTVMSYASMHLYGELFVTFMRARKKVFIDQLHWDLPETEGMEFDQYDTPQSRLIAVHEYGQILGGVRLSPTTARCGNYSYMLRDAQKGMLDSIPSDVLFFKAPVEDRIWEATRLFITDAVAAKRRAEVQKVLMEGMSAAAVSMGATSVIGIVPYVFSRWLKRIGMDAVPVGPKFSIDGTASQAALFNVGQAVTYAEAAE